MIVAVRHGKMTESLSIFHRLQSLGERRFSILHANHPDDLHDLALAL